MFLRKRKRYHAPPSFVKFAAFASGVENAEERPRAARDVDGLVVARGDGEEGAAGVVRGGQDDLRVKAHDGLHGGGEAAQRRAGHLELAEDAARKAELVDHVPVPVLRARVDEVARRGVRVFVRHLAREDEVQVLRHHQEALRLLDLLGVLLLEGGELIDGVEEHLLDSAARVELVGGDRRVHERVRALRAFIAVGHHVGAGQALLVKENEVDAPGIDADRGGDFADLLALGDALQHAARECLVVPAVVSVLADLRVVEAENLFEDHLPVFEMAEDVASRGRSDVDCEMVGHGLSPILNRS